jgi:uncharacterized protein YggE
VSDTAPTARAIRTDGGARETIITVRGSFEAHYPAERATLELSLGFEGATREPVVDATARLYTEITDALRGIHHPHSGPVTWWAGDQVRAWSEKPWNKDGLQLPPVHHARVEVRAKFRDFAVLGSWAANLSERSGVTVRGITWALTENRRIALTQHARTQAVDDARAKATAYAGALELSRVRVLELADAGMLGDGLRPAEASSGGYARATAMSASQGELQLKPEDIGVAASVDARFAAS